jgi:hypothetical protein
MTGLMDISGMNTWNQVVLIGFTKVEIGSWSASSPSFDRGDMLKRG